MRKLTAGSNVLVEGPYGQFSYKTVRRNRQVWIAGGIGITPFLSMARSFGGDKQYDIHFFYGTNTLDDAVFLQEFLDITRHLPDNFKTTVISRDVSGFVTVPLLQKSLDDLSGYDYLMCGPPIMIEKLREQLIEARVSEEDIYTESFEL
jgi:predicted ferric reductase